MHARALSLDGAVRLWSSCGHFLAPTVAMRRLRRLDVGGFVSRAA
jgi:hypothetical protein